MWKIDLPETHFSNSRIYDAQVVEIRDDLSLIILMSTADEVNVLSTPASTTQRNSISTDCLTPFMYLPVYIFEVCKWKSFCFSRERTRFDNFSTTFE